MVFQVRLDKRFLLVFYCLNQFSTGTMHVQLVFCFLMTGSSSGRSMSGAIGFLCRISENYASLRTMDAAHGRTLLCFKSNCSSSSSIHVVNNKPCCKKRENTRKWWTYDFRILRTQYALCIRTNQQLTVTHSAAGFCIVDEGANHARPLVLRGHRFRNSRVNEFAKSFKYKTLRGLFCTIWSCLGSKQQRI